MVTKNFFGELCSSEELENAFLDPKTEKILDTHALSSVISVVVFQLQFQLQLHHQLHNS